MAWLDLLAERRVSNEPLDTSLSTQTASLAVLDEPEFMVAVRDALRDFHRPHALRSNPLLCTRMVTERAGPGVDENSRVSTLQNLLKEAAESLQASPREAKCYRALYRTYLNPAPNQQSAAEILGLPFSTYRRHLKGGVTRVGEILWRKEIIDR